MPIFRVCAGAPGGQQTVLDSLELGSQAVISCWTWVLGTELGPLEEQQHF